MLLLDPDDVEWIVLHCSDSHYGDVPTIDQWHRERDDPFACIGYHWVVTNCYPTEENYKYMQPDISWDGLVHKGRDEKFAGAHVRGHNQETIGVCIVGAGGEFSSRQLISAAKLCNNLLARFCNCQGVKGHYEFDSEKECPCLDMDFFRTHVLPLGLDD